MTYGEHHKGIKPLIRRPEPLLKAAHLTREETILVAQILKDRIEERGALYPLPATMTEEHISKERTLRNKFRLLSVEEQIKK